MIRRVRIAYRINKSTNTHSEYAILTGFSSLLHSTYTGLLSYKEVPFSMKLPLYCVQSYLRSN